MFASAHTPVHYLLWWRGVCAPTLSLARSAPLLTAVPREANSYRRYERIYREQAWLDPLAGERRTCAANAR